MYKREIKAWEVRPYWPRRTCGCLIVFSMCIMLQMSGNSSRWSARSEYQRQPSCPLSSSTHNGMCNSVLHLNNSEGRKSNSQEALWIHRTSLSVWQVAQLCCWWWLSEVLDDVVKGAWQMRHWGSFSPGINWPSSLPQTLNCTLFSLSMNILAITIP